MSKSTPRVPEPVRQALHAEAGLLKRIDEVRELFELLRDDGLLRRYGWVAGWLASTDEFLTGLADAARTLEPEIDSTYGCQLARHDPHVPFPRPAPDYRGRYRRPD